MTVTRRRFLQVATRSGVGLAILAVSGCERVEESSNSDHIGPPLLTPDQKAFVLTHQPVAPVAETQWRLDVMVHHALRQRYTLQDLQSIMERHGLSALASVVCVFDGPDQDLAYSGVFRGISLAELLGPVPRGSKRIHITSVDGFRSSLPLSALNPEAGTVAPFLALEYMGQPLSHERGFPARLVAPGFYAYKHVKYVSQISYVDSDSAEGEFENMFVQDPDCRLTSSLKVNQPLDTSMIAAGDIFVSGYAIPSRHPVNRVELRIDDGPWSAARILPADALVRELRAASLRDPVQLSEFHAYPFRDVWVPWQFRWHASPGQYQVSVRSQAGGSMTDPVTISVTVI